MYDFGFGNIDYEKLSFSRAILILDNMNQPIMSILVYEI